MGAGQWRLLAIGPTTDVGEIRRAYAVALRAIDPDADTQGYAALQNARNFALAYASGQMAIDQEPSTGDNATIDAPIAQSVDPDNADIAKIEEHQRGLAALLLPGDANVAVEPLTFEEAEQLFEYFDALAADIRSRDIQVFGQASEWFACVIAQAIPRSDLLIEPAITLFGWSDLDQIHNSHAVAFVLARRAAIQFSLELHSKNHPLHRAWRELRTEATTSSKRGWVKRKNVTNLLSIIRSRFPMLENELDWYRVQMWERPPRQWSINGQFIGFAVAFVVAVSRFASAPPPSPVVPDMFSSRQPYEAGLVSQDGDVDRALQITLPIAADRQELRRNDPSLIRRLDQRWQDAKAAAKTAYEFDAIVVNEIENRMTVALKVAPPTIQRRAVALRIAYAKYARGSSWKDCSAVFYPNGIEPPRPEVLTRKLEEVRSDALVQASGTAITKIMAEPAKINFTVPGSIVGEIIDRTGLSQRAVASGLIGQGNAKQICLVHAALWEAALEARGTQGEQLRRHLVGGA